MMPLFALRHAFLRHGRACPGHPRLTCDTAASKTWMAGTSPAMTMRVGWRRSAMYVLGRTFASTAMALAMTIAAGAAEAPPCADCATQTLPSADMVPDLPATVPRNDPAVQAHVPGCAVWTDRCVTCQRDAGRISCSNIGIACQPQAVECVRPEPAEQK